MDKLTPRDGKDVEAIVAGLVASGRTAEPTAGTSKRGIGRPARTDVVIDLSGLTGVTLYEPEELVLSARAGTPLAVIEDLVAAHQQQLAFEPMDHGPLLGTAPGRATIGGILAANVSGPRRLKVGAARDHFLGFTAVSGHGETFKSGGRVVKNVTGYDLCKLMAGSWGTLAVLTDVTVKVLPRAETEATLMLHGVKSDADAIAAMTRAMMSSCDVSGAAHGFGNTMLRIEGVAPSVKHRLAALQSLLQQFGELSTLDEALSRNLWRATRDVAALSDVAGHDVWRISTAATKAAAIVQAVRAKTPAEALYDWAGGLIWLALPRSADAGSATVRQAVRQFGGHATLIKAPDAVRAVVDVFEPELSPLANLTMRVKDSFDPKRVLNPGRMWVGV